MSNFTGAQLGVAGVVLLLFAFDVLSFEFATVMLLFIAVSELITRREIAGQ